MKKHVRQALERAKAMGCECSITTTGRSGHYKMVAVKDGVTVDVPLSGSPKNVDGCINMALQMLRRRFLERGVELPYKSAP